MDTNETDTLAVSEEPSTSTQAVDSAEERVYTKAEVQAIKREAQALRARLREAEALIEARSADHTALSQTAEQAQAHAHALLDEVRGYRLRDTIARECAEDEAWRGLNADMLARLVTVEWDDQHQPTGVRDGIKAVLKRYPELVPQAKIIAQPSANGKAKRDTGSAVAQKRSLYPTM